MKIIKLNENLYDDGWEMLYTIGFNKNNEPYFITDIVINNVNLTTSKNVNNIYREFEHNKYYNIDNIKINVSNDINDIKFKDRDSRELVPILKLINEYQQNKFISVEWVNETSLDYGEIIANNIHSQKLIWNIYKIYLNPDGSFKSEQITYERGGADNPNLYSFPVPEPSKQHSKFDINKFRKKS